MSILASILQSQASKNRVGASDLADSRKAKAASASQTSPSENAYEDDDYDDEEEWEDQAATASSTTSDNMQAAAAPTEQQISLVPTLGNNQSLCDYLTRGVAIVSRGPLRLVIQTRTNTSLPS